MSQGALREDPLVEGDRTYADVSNEVCKPLESFPTRLWWTAFGCAATLMGFGFSLIGYMLYMGVGMSGIRSPVNWGMMIVTFVFWIGIGHAGTLISAILFLFRQKWRTAINRSAEAMTIFAVMCAGIFPLIHTGRPWYSIYWLFPYPNTMGPLWVNFRSPLLWDVFAVSTYLTISAVFWFTGLVPDLATVRDRCKNALRKKFYSILSLGWRGSSRGWHHYEVAYWILAGLSAPLVLSVHTIVSFDFAVSIIPGWHTTIFPPYFVAGAIFSGFAMVVTLLVIAREVFGLKQYITLNHLDSMNKVILATGMMVGLAYATEFFIAWYSGVPYERFIFIQRAMGPYAWAYWIMVSCNVLSPQFFWFRACRRSIPLMFILSIIVNIGMWFERFVIVVTSLANDFLPSSWNYFRLTNWDVGVLAGSFGMFFTLFLLFCRILPTISIAEVKSVIPSKEERIMAKKICVVGYYFTTESIMEAARKTRTRGFAKFDTFTPFAVHGMDDAMGIKRSPIPIISFVAGCVGLSIAMGLEIWTHLFSWPMNIGGKPLLAIPAYIPIFFELTVLVCGVTTAAVMFTKFLGLPNYSQPIFHPDITNDRFALGIEVNSDAEVEPVKRFLKEINAQDIHHIEGSL